MSNSLRCKIKKWCYQGKITEKERDRLIQGLDDTDRIKKINDINMRDATPEERESINKYIKSISKPTGVDFWDLKQEPKTDAVSRNDVIKMLNTMDRYSADKLRLCDTNKEFPHNEVFIVDDVYEKLNLLPLVKPQEPKTVHWIYNQNGTFTCDNCGCKHSKSNFCPNCGAEMKEGE